MCTLCTGPYLLHYFICCQLHDYYEKAHWISLQATVTAHKFKLDMRTLSTGLPNEYLVSCYNYVCVESLWLPECKFRYTLHQRYIFYVACDHQAV